jgi:hypothetical protein
MLAVLISRLLARVFRDCIIQATIVRAILGLLSVRVIMDAVATGVVR